MGERVRQSRTHGLIVPFAFGLAAALIIAGCTSTPPSAITVGLAPDSTAGYDVVRISGLSPAELAAVRAAKWDEQGWRAFLDVKVAGAAAISVAGRHLVTATAVEFHPRFPFDPGRAYAVRVDPARLPAPRPAAVIETTVSLASAPATAPTVVSAIYPSANQWPANLLRFYIHFSAPMSRENGVGRVHLLDASGEEVADALLPADVDFWNTEHTRYTVFFDPGRVKRGILPNRQMGRALVTGRRYSILIDAAWLDAARQPLRESYRHPFTAGPAIERAIDLHEWRISPPRAGTSDPLAIAFPGALDHALMQRAISVASASPEQRPQAAGPGPQTIPLDGTIAINATQTEWRFTPRAAWSAGRYEIVALSILEDPAGNRIGRAFEVAPGTTAARVEREAYRIPFEIKLP